MWSSRSGVVKLAIAIIIGLTLLKIAVGVMTGSLSILAQALDSFLDLFAVGVTFLAMHIAVKPADWEHPFGHGKVEYIAAIAQAVFIFGAGGGVIYSAVLRIAGEAEVAMTEAGMGVMLVSIIASVFLSRRLLKVSRELDSAALQANAHNIATDVYSAAAVLVGLLAVRLTGLSIIDPIIAIIVALLILKVAYDVLKRAFGGLIDVKLPEEEERIIRECITEHFGELVGFHELRTRKSGNQRYADLHVVMPRGTSVEDAHRLCDHLEEDIARKLRHTSMTIHVEPCGSECAQCPVTCGPDGHARP
ncbi:MAG: cation transporter [Chloroflexi bacterium]|nr:cation transporter [Chloroflexota bacterium]